MTTYVIGDIQGCYKTLQTLLKTLHFNPGTDTLWFVGDLVNRGPLSLQVVDFIMDLEPSRTAVVLGNHDLHLLAVYHGCQSESKHDTFQDILKAPHANHITEWLRNQPLLHYNPDLNIVMTHAGIYPLWTLTEALQYAKEVEKLIQSSQCLELFRTMYGNHPDHWDDHALPLDRARFIINAFTRMRLCTADGALELTTKESLDKIPEGLTPWFKLDHRKAIAPKLIFGHWAALKGEVDAPNIWGLDTGCVWGGELTAINLDNWKRVSVNSADRVS